MPIIKLFKPNLQEFTAKADYVKPNLILCFIKNAFYGFIFSLIILACFAIVVTYTPVGEKYISTIAMLASVSGALFAAFKCARTLKSKGILNGIISAVVYFLTIALLGVIFFEGEVNFKILLKNILYYIPVGMLGGILGVNIKSR